MKVLSVVFFFFNDTATTEIYTLSLHDALPIYPRHELAREGYVGLGKYLHARAARTLMRSEEHTSELQSQSNLVCRLLLEKKKKTRIRSAQNCTSMRGYMELVASTGYPSRLISS